MAKNLNSNLAYDLSALRQRQVKNKNYILSKSKQQSKINPFKISFILFTILVLSGMLIFSHINLNELNNSYNKLSKNLEELKSENTRLSLELESKTSLKNVEEYAKKELGLKKGDSSQIEYVSMPQKNKIEHNNKLKSIFDYISNFFENLMNIITNSVK